MPLCGIVRCHFPKDQTIQWKYCSSSREHLHDSHINIINPNNYVFILLIAISISSRSNHYLWLAAWHIVCSDKAHQQLILLLFGETSNPKSPPPLLLHILCPLVFL